MGYLPPHEYQGDMSVIRIPHSVVGALQFMGIVVGLQHYGYITAALTVVTIDDA